MPLVRESHRCWILLVQQECTGELLDFHWPVTDSASLGEIEQLRWHLFARDARKNPPEAQLNEEPCLTVACQRCGLAVGDGEHFAGAEHAWEAAENDGWQEDVCPFCQPSPHPV